MTNFDLTDFVEDLNENELFSTSHLISLRKQLDSCLVQQSSDKIICELALLRKASLDQIDTFISSDKSAESQRICETNLREFARQVFQLFLAKAWLPPIYRDENLDRIVDEYVDGVFQREVSLSDSDNTGHIVLGGLEGAGKTTILHAFAAAACVLFRKMTPVYWNYKIDDSTPTILHFPSTLLVEQFSLSPELRGLKQICQTLCKANILPLLIIDEFQAVYKRDGQTERRVAIAYEMSSFARQYRTFCVIAGSSAYMRSMLFRSHTDGEKDKWEDFEDFNGSLFSIYYIPALRMKEALGDYISLRYPDWKLTTEQIEQLLCSTGGIGRFVHSCFLMKNVFSCPVRRVNPLRYIHNNNGFLIFINMLIYAHEQQIEEHRKSQTLPCLSLPYYSMYKTFKCLGYNFDDLVNKWVEDGMAYFGKSNNDGPETIGVALPKDIYEFVDIGVSTSDRDIICLGGMISMILCNEDNAGDAMEILLCSSVHHFFPGVNAISSKEELSISSTNGLLVGKTVATVSDLDGRFFRWSGETGLDGVKFDWNFDNSELVVSGWQNNGGYYLSSIGGGKLQTSRKAFAKDGHVGNVNDGYIHGILVKAEVGFGKLVQALCTSFPSISKVSLGTLLITTSKNAHYAECSLEEMSCRFEVNPAVFGRFKKKVTGKVIEVILKHGLEWIRPCLSTALQYMLPPKWYEVENERKDPPGIRLPHTCKK